MGLRLKLGFYVVIFVSAILAAVGFLRGNAERETSRQEMEARGITLLRAFAIPCTVAMANHAAGYRCCNGMSVAFDHLGTPLVTGGHGGHEEQVLPLTLGSCVHLP